MQRLQEVVIGRNAALQEAQGPLHALKVERSSLEGEKKEKTGECSDTLGGSNALHTAGLVEIGRFGGFM